MEYDWKEAVRAVAPTIATVLGGPLAGTAVGAISNALLGKPDGTEEEISAILKTASPELLGKLRVEEMQFKLKLKEMGVEVDKLHAADRSSARQREIAVKDWAPSLIAMASFVGFFSILGFMMVYEMPERSVQPVNIMLGVLGGIIASITAYYFGSSKGSDNKDALLATR